MKRSSVLLYTIILFTFSFSNIIGVYAQNVPVLGEVQSAGKVFMSTSAGKWSPAIRTYPLLQDTGIRTEDGSSSIFLKDSSRVDLSSNTMVSINGETPNYSIHLAKGTIAFSMTEASSLVVSTPSASITVNSNSTIVRKVGYEKGSRILGIISATEKGTEVRSISGKILVASTATAARAVSSGESIFVSADSSSRIYRTQVVGGDATPEDKKLSSKNNKLPVAIVIGVGAGLTIYGLNQALKDNDRPASPYAP